MSILSCPVEDVSHSPGRPCQVCGEPIPPRHKMFCSIKCNSSAQYKKRKESGRAGNKYADMGAFRAAKARGTCSVSGCEREHTAKGFCLKHWKADKRRSGADWAVSGSDFKRRAVMYGVEYQRFDKRDVFTRDEWTCQLCGLPVDRDAKFPQPASPSIDHIVPISRGGAHVPSNTQCTHLQCNMRKSSKLEVG